MNKNYKAVRAFEKIFFAQVRQKAHYESNELFLLNSYYDGINSIDYDECEHVNLYRRFLEAPERMLKIMLEG